MYTLVFVDGLRELGDGRRHFQALLKDRLLPLDADVPRPFHEAAKILLRLDVTTNAEVLWGLLEEVLELALFGRSLLRTGLLAGFRL